MEVEVMLSGIGEQGVQLVAKILVSAAVAEDRYVMLSTEIGGEMRGGLSVSTVVVADASIQSAPVIDETSSAVVYHNKFSEKVIEKLRPNAVVMVNSSIFEGEPEGRGLQIFPVPATAIAQEMGLPMTAGLVMLGAYNQIAGIVSLESLLEAVHREVPSYRTQHIEGNIKALQVGAGYAANELGSDAVSSVWEGTSPILRAVV